MSDLAQVLETLTREKISLSDEVTALREEVSKLKSSNDKSYYAAREISANWANLSLEEIGSITKAVKQLITGETDWPSVRIRGRGYAICSRERLSQESDRLRHLEMDVVKLKRDVVKVEESRNTWQAEADKFERRQKEQKQEIERLLDELQRTVVWPYRKLGSDDVIAAGDELFHNGGWVQVTDNVYGLQCSELHLDTFRRKMQ